MIRLLLLPLLVLAGCSQQEYRPSPLDANASLEQIQYGSLADARIVAAFAAAGRPVPEQIWSLDDLVLAAQILDPAMAIARARLEQQQALLKTAAQSPNPVLSIATEHHSETDGGITPWSIGALFDFVFERPAKRAAREAVALAGVSQAELHLQHLATEIRLRVAETLQQLQARRRLMAQQQRRSQTLQSILDEVQRRVELGEASSFEASTARIDLQGLQLDQARQRVQAAELEQQLATAIGITLTELQQVVPAASEQPEKAAESIARPGLLQTGMLNQQPLMQAALARYQQAEAKLQLAIERQIPDFVLSPGLLFDQQDRIWQLAGQWTLPVFHRDEGAVLQAEAERQTVAAEVLQQQQQLLARLQQLDTRARSLLATSALARQLVVELEQRQHLLSRQQELGFSGSLESLRGLLELQQARQALLQIEADFQLTMLRLQHLADPAASAADTGANR